MSARNVIIEKWKKYNYIDSVGCRIWLDRYGEVIKAEDKNGKVVLVGRKGLSFSEPGIVFMPYLPIITNPCVVVFHDARDGRLKTKDGDGNITIIDTP